jgi:UDP-N-acetyl-D-mannosaminuronic acid dehydrogenase
VAVLGIAFKGRPETALVHGGAAGKLRAELAAFLPQAVFRGWDPVARCEAIEALGFSPYETATDAVVDANVVVLANDHPAVTALPLAALAATFARPALIYDLWGSGRGADCALPDGVLLHGLGNHRGRASPTARTGAMQRPPVVKPETT